MGKRLTASFVLLTLLSQLFALGLALTLMIGFRINPFHYILNLFISPGALFLGMIGASGAIAGCRISRMPAHGKVVLVLGVFGIFFVPIYYYCIYRYTLAQFGDFIPITSYADFLSYIFEHSRRSMIGHEPGAAMGSMGYSLLLTHIVSALVGNLAVVAAIDALPFCKACNQFHQKDAKRYLRFADGYTLMAAMDHVSQDPAERAMQLMSIADDAGGRTTKGTMRVKALQSHCDRCGEHALVETTHVFDGKAFRKRGTETRNWKSLRPRAAPLERRPMPPPAVAGFGRKGLPK